VTLAASLQAAKNKAHGLPCPIAVILRQLDDTDRAALQGELSKGLYDPDRLTNTAIQGALAAEGFNVHLKGVEKHRKQTCRCYVGTPK
jgi:hypothetical protein